jgi:hypothetical protein
MRTDPTIQLYLRLRSGGEQGFHMRWVGRLAQLRYDCTPIKHDWTAARTFTNKYVGLYYQK